MSLVLTPPKLVLLAVHLAATADIDSLAFLASRHPTVLRQNLVLRILLTYLPETSPSTEYVALLQELSSGEFAERDSADIDYTVVHDLSDDEASKKVRKLRLLPLSLPDAPADPEDDPVSLFLLRRSYRVDEEAGMLTQLPALLSPFLQHAPDIRIWMLSSLLPLLRHNYEYYPHSAIPYTLAEFQKLPDAVAVNALLSHTGAEGDLSFIGRDLRGLIGPWLHNDTRWVSVSDAGPSLRYAAGAEAGPQDVICPGWERVLEWLMAHASRSWKVAAAAIEQWNGTEDVDLDDFDSWLREEHQRYLDRRYARAILACAYLIPEDTGEALASAHQMIIKAMDLLGEDDFPSLSSAAESLSFVSDLDSEFLFSPKNTAWMRGDLLNEENPLTVPSQETTHLLHALILSAYLMTRAGLSYTVKRAGDLVFVQDEREQKAEAAKLIHTITSGAPRNDENYWARARREVLWLRDWGAGAGRGKPGNGVFGQVKADFLEAEILKALLSNTRYSLAKSLYEDSDPLDKQVLQDTIVAAALNAYDNASNPNRTRGGLKKCDEIINAFPKTISKSHPARNRIEALLKATHALSEYRLVLKQGEPFSPVVLRAHSDPITIVGKVLEQNPKSYTRVQDFLEVGSNMVKAGLTASKKSGSLSSALSLTAEEAHLANTEKRIIALCIQAALSEDDFETAYSFVVNRLTDTSPSSLSSMPSKAAAEDCSWRAALQAGQYIRNPHTTRPTHLGTASGNLEIRHLEQRIECLSTALRIAPASQLQEILKTFRRCEEQLDSALMEEAALEAADDPDEQQHHAIPGSFASPVAPSRRGAAAPAAARANTAAAAGGKAKANADEAPMSLFDLSRATARAASMNFSALSTLHASAGGGAAKAPAKKSSSPASASASSSRRSTSGHGPGAAGFGGAGYDDDDGGDMWDDWGDGEDGHDADGQPRARKRDQLRDAAMGTLTSGVGWLIGAPMQGPQGSGDEEDDRREERRSGNGW